MFYRCENATKICVVAFFVVILYRGFYGAARLRLLLWAQTAAFEAKF